MDSTSAVSEFLKSEVPDWDDEIICAARFKAFSGQRCDWEHRYQFWRGLIIDVSRHIGCFIIDAEQVKNKWFAREGLVPLCLDDVMIEMYKSREILMKTDLANATLSHFKGVFRWIANLIRISKSQVPEKIEGKVIVVPLVKEKADQVQRSLAETSWTLSCVITMEKFEDLCGGLENANVLISYFASCRKAQHFVNKHDGSVQGLKISLKATLVEKISESDHDVLHLQCTSERLQKQLESFEKRCKKLKDLATREAKSGHREAALRYLRSLKIAVESKRRCEEFCNRIEEILGSISDAESAKKVTEAIELGVKLINGQAVSVEKMNATLQDIDNAMAMQKEIQSSFDSVPLSTVDIEDEELEEELDRLESEIEAYTEDVQMPVTTVTPSSSNIPEHNDSGAAEILTQELSRLELEPA